MNIFRTLIETPDVGIFLADARHDGGKVYHLTVFPISNGIIGSPLSYGVSDLPDVVAKIENVLSEI